MIANNDRDYNQYEGNNTEENQSYVDQYQQEHISEENNLEEELLLNEDQSYLDNEFSNALERDDQEDLEQGYEQNALEEDDLAEEEDFEEEEDLDADELDDDLEEDYDENDREPETFADDGYKID
jgi:hypothetical protein